MTKILIVEDNEQLGPMLVERLERRGHQALLATEEGAGFASAKAAKPDLILLGAQLRGGEEWAMARALKYDELTRDIPILGLLAQNSDAARDAALHAGCLDVHYKPIDFGKLIAQIDEATRKEAPAPEENPA